MRILIDIQGAQSGSRHRGIGRYVLSLTKAILQERGSHDIYLLGNAQLHESIPALRDAFHGLVPDDRFIFFSGPTSVAGLKPVDAWRKNASEILRERLILDLQPDVVLLTSLFEGAIDDAVTSVKRLDSSIPTATVLYDLIPLSDPDRYLPAPTSKSWYRSKLDSLERSDLLLAISHSVKREALATSLPPDSVKVINSAADERFRPRSASLPDATLTLRRLGIEKPFIMHTSAFEPRKNFEGLIDAVGLLPKPQLANVQLVLVSAIPLDGQIALRERASLAGLPENCLVFAGHVSDDDLCLLYATCALFVFPSFHEGFGLPVLEAMCCGAPVIGSNTTSIPEVIGRSDALFDPFSPNGIASLINRALTDTTFYRSLKEHSQRQAKHFSWTHTARLTLAALEELVLKLPESTAAQSPVDPIGLFFLDELPPPTDHDLLACATALAKHERFVRRLEIARTRTTTSDKPSQTASGSANAARDAQGRVVTAEALRPPSLPNAESTRILIIKLDHIGDFVISIDAFKIIRDGWPNAHLTIVCGPWNKSLAAQLGFFDEIRTFRYFPEVSGLVEQEALDPTKTPGFQELRLGPFDLAIDFRYYQDTRQFLDQVDAQFRAGYAADGCTLDLSLPCPPEHLYSMPVAARVSALAASVVTAFGGGDVQRRHALVSGRPANAFFSEQRVIGIAPGAGNSIKAWGTSRFIDLVRMLKESGPFKFLILGGERDKEAAALIAASLPAEEVCDLAGQMDIADISPLLAGLALFVGNDTSTTHIAASVGIPVVCLFSGQPHFPSWRPQGPMVVTLKRTVPCSPCYLQSIDACQHHHACMAISPDEVLETCLGLL